MGQVEKKATRIIFALALLCALAPSSRANTFTIIPNFDSSITNDPNSIAIEGVINQAIQVYETVFNNPITLNITFSELTSGVGQALYTLYQIPYSEFYTALGDEAASPLQQTVLASLQPGDTNPVTGTTNMLIKPANAAALGIDLGLGINASAGTVLINPAYTNPGTTGTTGQYSLLTIVEHEIDTVLGLGSTLGLTLPGGESNMPSPEDLFRYDSNGNRSFTTSTSAQAYFSLTGQSLLFQFNNTGVGDYGASLPSNGVAHVQDAFAVAGSNPTLGPTEITALEAIGYTSPLPEPGTWVLLGTGLGIIGWMKRKA